MHYPVDLSVTFLSAVFISINGLVVACVAWWFLSNLSALRKLRSRANELQSRVNERSSREEPRLDNQPLFGKGARAPAPKVLLEAGRPDTRERRKSSLRGAWEKGNLETACTDYWYLLVQHPGVQAIAIGSDQSYTSIKDSVISLGTGTAPSNSTAYKADL